MRERQAYSVQLSVQTYAGPSESDPHLAGGKIRNQVLRARSLLPAPRKLLPHNET